MPHILTTTSIYFSDFSNGCPTFDPCVGCIETREIADPVELDYYVKKIWIVVRTCQGRTYCRSHQIPSFIYALSTQKQGCDLTFFCDMNSWRLHVPTAPLVQTLYVRPVIFPYEDKGNTLCTRLLYYVSRVPHRPHLHYKERSLALCRQLQPAKSETSKRYSRIHGWTSQTSLVEAPMLKYILQGT